MNRTTYETAWAGANQLKKHCHFMLQTLGPATPPEVFLYRGNAYYALGYPYLALADYENAAKFLSISAARHQEKCWAAAKKFPATQRAIYPGSSSHLHICVNPFLDAKCAVRIGPAADATAPQQGGTTGEEPEREALWALNDHSLTSRRLIATESFPAAGLPVVKPPSFTTSHSHHSGPWLQYPLQEACCARCAKPLHRRGDTAADPAQVETRTSMTDRRFPCTNEECHEEYCSRDCRQLALQEYHGSVCTNAAVQSIEMDLFAKMTDAQDVLQHRHYAALLLTLRVLSASLGSQASPTALPQVRILAGRLDFSPMMLCGELREEYQRMAEAMRVTTTVSYEEFIGIYARVLTNAHWSDETEAMFEESLAGGRDEKKGVAASATADGVERNENTVSSSPEAIGHDPYPATGTGADADEMDYHAIQLHLPYAMLNHSCDPNVVVGHVRLPVMGSHKKSSSSSLGASAHAPTFRTVRTLVTARPVEAGEELTRSYFPASWIRLAYQPRREAMLSLGFECQCPRCLAKN